jgi:hypothetical protein
MEEEILEEINNNANEIIEIDENDEISNTQYDMEQVNIPNGKKEKKPSKSGNKKKIIIIISVVFIILVSAFLFVYFLILRKDSTPDKPKDPVVVIEKDNCRYEDGKLIFIDKDKNELGSYICENKSENLCYVANFSNEDDFDSFKRVYENGLPINNRTDILLDNYVFVYDNMKKENGNIALYDINKEKVLDTYNLVKEVKDNKVIYKKDNKYGLIEVNDNEVKDVIQNSYDYMGYIEDTNALVVSNNSNYYLIGFDGIELTKSVPGAIKTFDDNKLSVKVGSSYYVYGYDGKMIVDKAYDYIRFVDNYAIAADGKKLYVFDKDGSPMNMDGVRISSNSYNTKLIFNDNLRQVGKEEAFNVSVTDKTMRIEYDEEAARINLNEGAFNKTLEYVSYFEGKLYFYSDSEKTELLGSYACNYANGVSEGDEALGNCFIAKESNIFKSGDKIDNGFLPIFNKRYVFIADTKTPNTNDNIILWDLKDKKKLATYKSVDAGFHDITNVIDFVDTAGTLVIAKSSEDDAYGVINITQSSIKGFIPFRKKDDDDKVIAKNVSFKVLDNYYLFKQDDDTYHLYDKNGKELTKNITTKYEIVKYKDGYLMVKNNEKYLIYDKDGKIISNEYKNIIMENKFYITIDSDNIVGVFKYDSKDDLTSSLEEKIRIDGIDISKELTYSLKNDLLKITYTNDGNTTSVDINVG